ncbi:hypothetical protein FZW96_12955 [Bacillus sp. BGMRC 2118]|nr:hypothetical protein FZW96_12955 [Bacillus sp. BGMRC 2118]
MILTHEIRKIIKMPIIVSLIIFFLTLNILLIVSNSDQNNELNVVTDLVNKYGYVINDEMLQKWTNDYQEIITWVNQIAPNKEKEYKHPSELLEDNFNQIHEKLSREEIEQLVLYSQIESYLRTSTEIDAAYEEINLKGYADSVIHMYGLKGTSKEAIQNQYEKLHIRLGELTDHNEHKNLFFMGTVHEMHSLLFKDIGRALVFELMILVVLITASITNYEFEHRTALVSYTSKRGRKLVVNKFLAALFINTCTTVLIVGITLWAYFSTFNYSGLWKVSISNYFNTEMKLPYISWWELSFVEYLLLSMLLLFLVQIIFMSFSFVFSIYLKNTYLVFFLFAALVGIGILLPSLVPLTSELPFILNCNPFTFILNPHEWMMGNGHFTIYKFYEAITLGVWIVLLGSFSIFSVYKFRKQELM